MPSCLKAFCTCFVARIQGDWPPWGLCLLAAHSMHLTGHHSGLPCSHCDQKHRHLTVLVSCTGRGRAPSHWQADRAGLPDSLFGVREEEGKGQLLVPLHSRAGQVQLHRGILPMHPRVAYLGQVGGMQSFVVAVPVSCCECPEPCLHRTCVKFCSKHKTHCMPTQLLQAARLRLAACEDSAHLCTASWSCSSPCVQAASLQRQGAEPTLA